MGLCRLAHKPSKLLAEVSVDSVDADNTRRSPLNLRLAAELELVRRLGRARQASRR